MPELITSRSMAWVTCFVSPSAALFELRTKPISDIVLLLKSSRAAAMSSIILFSDVRDPFYITSNRDLLSVKRCTAIWRPSIVLSSTPRVIATSKRSLKAITSPAIDDRVIIRDL